VGLIVGGMESAGGKVGWGHREVVWVGSSEVGGVGLVGGGGGVGSTRGRMGSTRGGVGGR
jgi:hypothetical protein